MRSISFRLGGALGLLAIAAVAHAQPVRVPIETEAVLTPQGVSTTQVDYKGRKAVKVVEAAGSTGGPSIAAVKNVALRDGTIEVDLAGAVAAGAPEGARGFIGVAFRVSPTADKYEYIYLRPTNGRVDDQVRRNHSTQYASHPDFPWQRLRKEFPEKYESYVDLEPGVWTRVKIVVQGTSARLYVHGAPQPCLVVTDLKLGEGEGGIALWIGAGTEGYFADLRVTKGASGAPGSK
jgi:hypothetical protein